MSVRIKVLEYLHQVPYADEYSIKEAVNSWHSRQYKESTIERRLRNMTQQKELRSMYWNGKMWYRYENPQTASQVD